MIFAGIAAVGFVLGLALSSLGIVFRSFKSTLNVGLN